MDELDRIAVYYSTYEGMNAYNNYYQYNVIRRYFKGNKLLELGCADGMVTSLLIDDFTSITVVDGSYCAVERLKKNIKSGKPDVIVGYFEEIELEERFDTILMGHILEHVEDPVFILKKFKKYLNDLGVIIITVPNALSFHRLIGVGMGLLDSVYSLNDSDKLVGHKRVYDFERLKADVEMADLKVVARDAYFLKFLSNQQFEVINNSDLIEACMKLGEDFRQNAAEIVLVASS
jgi:2-polyprenyl-3-methyl-5-hydroxy-6-metoxy-1,4-benzoquinol methylase